MAKGTVISPKNNSITFTPLKQATKRRVAIYVRIGGCFEDALENIKSEINHATNFAEKCGYQVVKSYGNYGCKDKGGIGKCAGFKQLIKDAQKGEFDLIVTKSINRFGGNTIKTIETINKLNKLGIEVYFEKENIYSFNPDAESILKLICSIAKKEQISILEATKKWQK